MRGFAIIAILAMPGCTDLSFGLGATIREGGNTTVSPTVSGRIGDLGVAVSG